MDEKSPQIRIDPSLLKIFTMGEAHLESYTRLNLPVFTRRSNSHLIAVLSLTGIDLGLEKINLCLKLREKTFERRSLERR